MFRFARQVFIAASASAAVFGSAVTAVHAQDFPARPVKLIVPSTPGGAIDIVARIIGPKLAIKWGQPVVIDNRAGASGIIGTDALAKSAPDGHTLLLVTTGFVTNSLLYQKVPYNVPEDFTPITDVGTTANVLVAHPSTQIVNIKQLIEYGKANPGKLNYASSGFGSGGYLSMALLSQMAGIEMTHVPYSGAGAALQGVVSNQTQLLSSAISAVKSQVGAKSLIPLAIMGTKRSDVLPNVPTLAEAGVPGYAADSWYGLMAPKGVPPALSTKIHADVVSVLQMPDVRKQMEAAGFEPGGMKPNEFLDYIVKDQATWKMVLAKTPPQEAARK